MSRKRFHGHRFVDAVAFLQLSSAPGEEISADDSEEWRRADRTRCLYLQNARPRLMVRPDYRVSTRTAVSSKTKSALRLSDQTRTA